MSRRGRSCLAAVLGALALASAFADEAPRYRLRESDPRTGTMLREEIASSSALPFDKTWSELSNADKARVRSWYESMGEGDEPPYPAHGLGPIYRDIGVIQQKLLVRGPLLVYVSIDEKGEATSVSILRDVDEPKMTRAVANILMLQTYKPALCAGKPCSMKFPFSIDFKTKL